MEVLTRFVRSFWQPIVVALLALVVVGQLVSWGYTALQMHSIDQLVEAAQNDPNDESEEQSGSNPGPRRGPPPQQQQVEPTANIFHRQRVSYMLTAIFKDQAVINGQTVKAGGRIGNATLEEIRLASVMIHEDGKPQPQEIKMFQGSGGSGGGPRPPRPPSRRGSSAPPPNMTRGGPPQVIMSAPPAVNPAQAAAGMRSRMIQRFRSGTLSIEDVPPEHRKRFREVMARREARQRDGGGRRGPRGR